MINMHVYSSIVEKSRWFSAAERWNASITSHTMYLATVAFSAGDLCFCHSSAHLIVHWKYQSSYHVIRIFLYQLL